MSAHPSTLYSETVLAHNRAPHNCGCLESATHHGVAENAMCGDHLELSLRVRDGVIDAVRSGPAARDEFAAFAELCHHPARQRCALLPFDAALAALQTRE